MHSDSKPPITQEHIRIAELRQKIAEYNLKIAKHQEQLAKAEQIIQDQEKMRREAKEKDKEDDAKTNSQIKVLEKEQMETKDLEKQAGIIKKIIELRLKIGSNLQEAELGIRQAEQVKATKPQIIKQEQVMLNQYKEALSANQKHLASIEQRQKTELNASNTAKEAQAKELQEKQAETASKSQAQTQHRQTQQQTAVTYQKSLQSSLPQAPSGLGQPQAQQSSASQTPQATKSIAQQKQQAFEKAKQQRIAELKQQIAEQGRIIAKQRQDLNAPQKPESADKPHLAPQPAEKSKSTPSSAGLVIKDLDHKLYKPSYVDQVNKERQETAQQGPRGNSVV